MRRDGKFDGLFFMAAVGAILVVLAVFAVVAFVLGDDDDLGGNVNDDPPGSSAPRVSGYVGMS